MRTVGVTAECWFISSLVLPFVDRSTRVSLLRVESSRVELISTLAIILNQQSLVLLQLINCHRPHPQIYRLLVAVAKNALLPNPLSLLLHPPSHPDPHPRPTTKTINLHPSIEIRIHLPGMLQRNDGLT